MNCKSIQMSLSVDEKIGPRESLHIETCRSCKSFAAHCESVGRRLAACRPVFEGQVLRRVDRKHSTRWDWKAVALAAVSAVVVAAPIATYLTFGRRAAADVPKRFHVVMKGTGYVFGSEQPIDYEAWFNGKKLRFTFHGMGTMDQIMWSEDGCAWRSWKPDGVLVTGKAPMASPQKSPSEFVSEGKYASAKFFKLVLDQYAPITPSTVRQPKNDEDLPGGERCAVTRYAIKRHHVGMTNRWQEDFNSEVFVYTSRASGRILRIRQVVDEGNGKTATLEYNYDYAPITSDHFDPNTLQSIPTTSPARRG